MRLPAWMSPVERPPLWWRALWPGVLFRMDPSRREVYLTFDDGPDPDITPWVLGVLERRGIHATFFMVGDNVRRRPDLLERVLAAGHRTGNHTMHHLQGVRVRGARYLADTLEAQGLLPDPQGRPPLFRPPHGLMRPGQLKALAGRYTIVMHDLVTRDYSRRLTAGDVTANVRRLARPGSIVVFHDSPKAWPRLRTALEPSLDWLLEQGYGFGLL